MVIINGNISDSCNVILDNGYTFGQGVFETILIKKQPLFLKQHCERMKIGLSKLNIRNIVDEDYIIECVKKYNIHDCVMKVIATEKNIVISTRKSSYKPEDYIKGFKVKLSSIKRNPYSHVTYLKSLNFTDNLIEREQAAREGFDEVLFLNTRNELTEGSVSNLFFVKDCIIYTPEISCGILNGIIREWVIKNFEVCEGKFSLELIKNADEVFITNSIMGIMKVSYIENLKIESNDKVYNEVKEKYEKLTNPNFYINELMGKDIKD